MFFLVFQPHCRSNTSSLVTSKGVRFTAISFRFEHLNRTSLRFGCPNRKNRFFRMGQKFPIDHSHMAYIVMPQTLDLRSRPIATKTARSPLFCYGVITHLPSWFLTSRRRRTENRISLAEPNRSKNTDSNILSHQSL